MVSHPNRTPEVVRGCSFHHGFVCNVLCITGVAHRVVWRDDSLPPPPGWHSLGAIWHAPHVVTTPRGEIRGRTAATASGVAEMARNADSWGDGAVTLWCCTALQGAYLWHAYRFIVLIPAQLRKCRAMDRETALR